MNTPESVPSVGSQVGRYRLLREIAKGPLGSLYEVRSTDGLELGGLGRILALASDLPPAVEQRVSGSAWDSMEVRHDLALCVADVAFDKGWLALIHDHAEGTLMRSLQRRCYERTSAFPLGVALRVAIDVLDGLERSQKTCESAGIPWCPGGTSANSLYLCGDGRTRSLDGVVATTMTRVAMTNSVMEAVGFPPPELLANEGEPDERADVFAVAALLWELLTGRELTLEAAVVRGHLPRANAAKLDVAVPKGTTVPNELVQLVTNALELDPAKRPATRNDWKAALVQVGELASYEKVIDFTDALLNRESTLFRLTLDAGPRLSDELTHDRPKPNHLEWAAELAKHARVVEMERGKSSAQIRQRTSVATAPPKPVATAPPKPMAALAAERPEAAGKKRALAQKTLIGIAAPAEVPRPTTDNADQRSAATKPVSVVETDESLSPSGAQAKATPVIGADVKAVPAGADAKAAPAIGAQAKPVPATAADAKAVRAGADAKAALENGTIAKASVASSDAREALTVGAHTDASVVSGKQDTTRRSAESSSINASLQGSVAQALCEQVLAEQGISGHARTANRTAILENVPETALDPLSRALAAPVAASGDVRGSDAPRAQMASKRVVQLSLPAILVGVFGICLVAVGTTLVALRWFSRELSSPSASSTTVAGVSVADARNISPASEPAHAVVNAQPSSSAAQPSSSAAQPSSSAAQPSSSAAQPSSSAAQPSSDSATHDSTATKTTSESTPNGAVGRQSQGATVPKATPSQAMNSNQPKVSTSGSTKPKARKRSQYVPRGL